jgi:Ion channel
MRSRHSGSVISQELGRLRQAVDQQHHHRLIARLALVGIATLVVDAFCSVLIFFFERHAKGTEISSFGDAVFFTTVQLLTVSSQIKNPLTPAGRVLDVFLEIWAVIVVAGSAGAMADFFNNVKDQ